MNVNIDSIAGNFDTVKDWVISWFTSTGNDASVLCLEDSQFVTRIMCTMWYIWKDRCSLVFQGIKPNVQTSSTRVSNLIQQCINYFDTNTRGSNNLQVQVWVPPKNNFIKINIDGSYIPSIKKGSVGIIIRNFSGHCLRAIGYRFEEEVDEEYGVEYFECKSLELAVNWMEDLQIGRVIFEMDCDNVIRYVMEQQSQVHWFNSSIIERVEAKSNSSSKLWFFKSIHRLGNNVSHSLARKARDEDQDFCFTSSFPDSIINLLNNDLSNIAV
ncbi:uncharacterized protein LOC113338631 [Papaver somniferum]|uniref:uncharacterized protein LOC113338631 n=1 Tax=Papaver somniferum TaxID=3469 RepID=UPI000E6F6705|nr:uncharacterized protein LOC113338631 [Papaver somniferum]